jgi:hypothetical protein
MMSENIEKSESKLSFLFESQEAPELKFETAGASGFSKQSDNNSESLADRLSLPQFKESAARVRLRLCRGRGIF